MLLGVDAGLGLGKGVGTPFADATRVEVVMAPPAAADVGRVVWPPGDRAQPGVPVHFFLGGLGLFRQPGVAHLGGIPGGDVCSRRLHLAQPPDAGQLDGRDETALAKALNSGLVDAPVPPRRLDHLSPLGDRHARRLLGINVLARPHRHDCRQRVPAIAGGDQDRVDVRPGREELAHLRIHLAVGVAVMLVDDLLDGLAAYLARVADRDELHVLLPEHPVQVELAAAAEADAPEHDALARCDRAASPERGCRDNRRHEAGRAGRSHRLETMPAIELLCDRSDSRHGAVSVKMTLRDEPRRNCPPRLVRLMTTVSACLGPAHVVAGQTALGPQVSWTLMVCEAGNKGMVGPRRSRIT